MGQEQSAGSVTLPSLAGWQEAVGTVFAIGAPERLVLTLDDVATFDRATGWESFTPRFSGPPGLHQGTYALEHDGLGTFRLFLVPVALVGETRLYEAVFNRPVPSP